MSLIPTHDFPVCVPVLETAGIDVSEPAECIPQSFHQQQSTFLTWHFVEVFIFFVVHRHWESLVTEAILHDCCLHESFALLH